MQGHGARVTVSFLGLGRKSSFGGRRHGKGQLGSGGLAGGLNFPPRDWEADKGFKTAVTAWGWAFGEDDAAIYGCSWVAFQAFVPGDVFTSLRFVFAVLAHRSFDHHLCVGKEMEALGQFFFFFFSFLFCVWV